MSNGTETAHSGSGPLNVNTGTGEQRNSTQSGGTGNTQVNADVYNHNYFAPAETRPEFRGTYSYTSLKPVASYVARSSLQEQIEQRLDDARATEPDRSIVLVLIGLGGAGKTQLALSYTKAHRQEYNGVFWVDARLRDSIERDFLQIYYLLLGGVQNAASLQADIARVITAVKTWFEGRDGRWLFVLDNVDSLDDENDPYYIDLARYLPEASCVEVIITTRTRTALGMTELEAVEVGKLAPSEAIDIFVRCSKLRNAGEDVLGEVGRIVHELDYLVLAITLAGAYVEATPRIRSNIKDYLPEYERQRKKLLGRKAKQQIHRYGESVLSTWETSYTAIEKQCPAAVKLLSLFAFLDSKDIFLELFPPKTASVKIPSRNQNEGCRAPVLVVTPLEDVLDEAFEALKMYSLVKWEEEQGSYSMHKLVHTWGFERLGNEEQEIYSLNSLALLQKATEKDPLSPKERLRLVPHISSSARRLQERCRSGLSVPNGCLNGLRPLGIFAGNAGQYDIALELFTLECAERERRKDEDQERWLLSLSNLAWVLLNKGRYNDAQKMVATALKEGDKVLKKNRPLEAQLMSHLGWALQYQGEYDKAENWKRQAIAIREKALGEEHEATLKGLCDLGTLLVCRREYEAAEQTYRKALKGLKKTLGRQHRSTLTAMMWLGSLLEERRKYHAAEKICRRTIEAMEEVMGREHGLTLMCLRNLASVKSSRGDCEAAEKMQRQAIEGQEKVSGKEHPATLISYDRLANILRAGGKYEAAEEMCRQALEGMEKVFGHEHHVTFKSVNGLGLVLKAQGKYEEAKEAHQRAMEGHEKLYGKEYPDTLVCARNLALVLKAQGKYGVAEEVFQRALEGFEKVLGKEHRDTRLCARNLVSLLRLQGKQDEADALELYYGRKQKAVDAV